MATVRVHELAKDMNMTSRELLGKLQALGLNLKNHMSTIPSSEVNRIKSMVLNLSKSEESPSSEAGPPSEKTKQGSPSKPGDKKGTGGTQAKSKQKGAAAGRKRPATKQKNKAPQPLEQNEFVEDPFLHKIEKVVGEKAYERGGKAKTTKRSRFEDKRQGGKKGGRPNQLKGKKRDVQHREPAPVPVKQVTLDGPLTVQEFAHLINKKAGEVIKKLMSLGVLATINQELDEDTLILLGSEFGITVELKASKEDLLLAEEPDDPQDLVVRPPVVTVMGHVDHGKTSLLDAIRKTNVTAQEAGGITQHIGAYQVTTKGRKITFLDTPGHEAFTAMRARGAQVTDIAVLVVAADDGVMPQTIEAINHAQAAKVPIIVAVNKIDKPEANPNRVRQELVEHGLVPEEWGGDTIFVDVSAHTKEGLDTLLEMILLVADMAELKANPNKRAQGTVIEAKLDKGRGPVATVLVENGTLEVGDFMIVGTTQGRVRAMQDDRGRNLKKALPSVPVEIIGLSEVPLAGDGFRVVANERLGKQIASERIAQKREETINARARVSLDDLFSRIQEGEVKDLNLIVKADVQGSIEALKQSLEKLSNKEVRVNIIHHGVGAIAESDVMLASASNAIIIGFNVRPDMNARKLVETQQIDIRLYRVIYDAIEDIKAALSGLLKPEIREVIQGRAEVRATFKVPKAGVIAGCYVTEGKITRNSKIRVIRDGIVLYEGEVSSLKRFKDDVREVASGYECGLGITNYNDIREGDHLEAFGFEEIKRELS
jgi:translation initiation factor IF-2